MDIKQIENLIEKAQIIKNKYDDLAEYTGENFNVFNILRLDKKELIHSAFIANLLNAKGNHGQKDVFLKFFINDIKGLFLENESFKDFLNEFDTSLSFSIEEDYIGRVDYDLGLGGRIDIVIKSVHHPILIENKISAGDQDAQLYRYHSHYPKSPIIYLTPFGNEPTTLSKGKLKKDKDFICISYETHIVNWLEKCIKEMANKPIIRETLNQYLHLVKQITNQTTNNKMEMELKQLIINNREEVKVILDAYNSLRNDLMKRINELHILLNDSENTRIIQEILKESSGFDFVINKPWNDGGVKIFNFKFFNSRLEDIFFFEIHENENIDFSIVTGFWGFKGYESIFEEFSKIDNHKIITKTYNLNLTNEEIINDILERLMTVMQFIQNKFSKV